MEKGTREREGEGGRETQAKERREGRCLYHVCILERVERSQE